jgi:hypothetical protein
MLFTAAVPRAYRALSRPPLPDLVPAQLSRRSAIGLSCGHTWFTPIRSPRLGDTWRCIPIASVGSSVRFGEAGGKSRNVGNGGLPPNQRIRSDNNATARA